MEKFNQIVIKKNAEQESSNIILQRMVMDDQFQYPSCKEFTNAMYTRSNKDLPKKTRMRFAVCTLGVISLAMSCMSRNVINFCITTMVDPRVLQEDNKTVSNEGSCPIPGVILLNAEERMDFGLSENQSVIYMGNQGDPGKSQYYPQIISVDSLPLIGQDTDLGEEKFMWTIKQQSYVKGGFYYGYFLFMILGGRLAEIYGAKYVLFAAVAGSGIINSCTPWMARNSLTLLIISRVVMGAVQSSAYPAMYALINRWLTSGEASIYTPMIKMSLRLGQVLASIVTGLILEWPNVFYLVGAFAIVWSILWLLIATSDPSTNKWVSEAELDHIMKHKKRKSYVDKSLEGGQADGTDDCKTTKTPWLKIITLPSFIGLCAAKLAYNFCNDFLTVELPSYLKYVHHTPLHQISAISTAMFTMQVPLVLLAGWLAKYMVKKQPFNLSKTSTRKIFQSIATFGTGILLLLLIFNDCSLTYVAVDLQFVALVGVFVVGGEMMLPYDLSEEYPATIMAMANSVANTSGIIETALTGLILGNQGGSQARWNMVIGWIASVVSIGGLLFSLLVKAEPMDLEPKRKYAHSIEDVEGASSTIDKIETDIQANDQANDFERHSNKDDRLK